MSAPYWIAQNPVRVSQSNHYLAMQIQIRAERECAAFGNFIKSHAEEMCCIRNFIKSRAEGMHCECVAFGISSDHM